MMLFRRLLAKAPALEAVPEPEHCKAVVKIGNKGAICFHDVSDHPEFHEGRSLIHEAGSGVIVRWLGTDSANSMAYCLDFVDEVDGKTIDNDRLVESLLQRWS